MLAVSRAIENCRPAANEPTVSRMDRYATRRGGILAGMKFRAVVELGGKTATGLVAPGDVVAALGNGKRPAVRASIGAHTYRTTVTSMGGWFLVPLSAENRAATGVSAGDEVEVEIEADHEPREVIVPADLATALGHDATAQAFFERLAYTHSKEWVRWVGDVKKTDTRTSRITKTVAALHAGTRTR